MMECQIARYCIFTKAPEDLETTSAFQDCGSHCGKVHLSPNTIWRLWVKMYCRSCRRPVHSWCADTPAILFIYTGWSFLYEMYRFPIPALISQLSQGFTQLILICGSERETLLNNDANVTTCEHTCACAFTYRFCWQAGRACVCVNAVKRHYCWWIVSVRSRMALWKRVRERKRPKN